MSRKTKISEIKIYTDGSCLGNPGYGGWAYCMISPQRKTIIFDTGSKNNVTNNFVELFAVLKALNKIKRLRKKAIITVNCQITLYSDSQYVVNMFKKHWADQWYLNKWRNASNQPVKNKELISMIYPLVKRYKVEFKWIKGHNNDNYNEICDKMARQSAEQLKQLINNSNNINSD